MLKRKIYDIVDQIIKEEEKKYNMKLDVRTISKIDYYIENIKNKTFSLKNDNPISSLAALGLTRTENSKTTAYIFKNKIIRVLFAPANLIFNEDYLESDLASTTYHEIRHIIQFHQRSKFTALERFCFNYLRYEKEYYDNHDKYYKSTYHEIDANMYGARKTMELYPSNQELLEHYQKEYGSCICQKMTYDFDFFLEKYIENTEYNEEDFESEAYYKYQPIQTFWNQDRTFKSLKEILIDNNYYKNTDLKNRIVTSNVYLNSINYDNLSDDEINLLDHEISILIEDIHSRISVVNTMYSKKYIDDKQYSESMTFLNNLLDTKINYKNELQTEKTSLIR